MEALLTQIHHSLSGITATDVTVASGAIVTGAQYLLNNILNLKERRFVKAALSYVVTPAIITGAVALFHAFPDFSTHFPEVALLGQGFYYTVEAIISAAQKDDTAPVASSAVSAAVAAVASAEPAAEPVDPAQY